MFNYIVFHWPTGRRPFPFHTRPKGTGLRSFSGRASDPGSVPSPIAPENRWFPGLPPTRKLAKTPWSLVPDSLRLTAPARREQTSDSQCLARHRPVEGRDLEGEGFTPPPVCFCLCFSCVCFGVFSPFFFVLFCLAFFVLLFVV